MHLLVRFFVQASAHAEELKDSLRDQAARSTEVSTLPIIPLPLGHLPSQYLSSQVCHEVSPALSVRCLPAGATVAGSAA